MSKQELPANAEQVQADEAKVVKRMYHGRPTWGFDCARGFAPYGHTNTDRIGAEEIAEKYRRGDKDWTYRPIANSPLIASAEPSGVQAGQPVANRYDLQTRTAPAAHESSADAAWEPAGIESAASGEYDGPAETCEHCGEDIYHDGGWRHLDTDSADGSLQAEPAHPNPRETVPTDAALDCVRELRDALLMNMPDEDQASSETFAEAWTALNNADALLAQGDAGAEEEK